MAPSYYGQAVEAWGREGDRKAVRSIALRGDAALRRTTRMDGSLTAPDIEMRVEYKEGFRTLYSIQDTPADLHETLERVSETDSEHEQRQKRLWDAFLAFRDRLTEQECHIILDHFGLDAFRTMMELNPDLADRWYALFMRLPETRLPAAHNFVLHLAHALAGRCPARAAELFRRAGDGRPMVRVALGYTQVPLDAMSIWGGSDRGGLDDLRFQRLDGAENDHVISQEVLAAHLNGRQDLLLVARLKWRMRSWSQGFRITTRSMTRCSTATVVLTDSSGTLTRRLGMPMTGTHGHGIGSSGCVTRATAWNSGAPPFCSRRSSTDDTIFGNRSTRFEANPCSCSGPASEPSCGIESGSGRINARRSCSDKRFPRKFFFVRGELTRANPSNGHESMPAERRVALISAA